MMAFKGTPKSEPSDFRALELFSILPLQSDVLAFVVGLLFEGSWVQRSSGSYSQTPFLFYKAVW